MFFVLQKVHVTEKDGGASRVCSNLIMRKHVQTKLYLKEKRFAD